MLAVLALCIVFLVVADVLGRLFVDPNFHISDLMLGTLCGLGGLLLGVDMSRRGPSK